MSETREARLARALTKARDEVVRLSESGGKSFRMSIPAHPDDTDLVIADALDAALRYLALSTPPEATPEPPTPEPERPAARCVWDEDTSWRGTFISRCELTTNFAKRDMQGWRVCPYCGQPLSVEEDTHVP